jgi:hypothetical protein
VKIARCAQRGTRDVLAVGLPGMTPLIHGFGVDAVVQIAEAAQQNTFCVFRALPAFQRRIESADDLRSWGEALCDIASLSGHNAGWVSAGLAIFKDRVQNVTELKLVGTILAQIAAASRGRLNGMLECGIPRIADRYRELLTDRTVVIADLRTIRRGMREPVWSNPDASSGGLSTGGAVSEITSDPDGAEGIDNTIAALEKADFSKLTVVTSRN